MDIYKNKPFRPGIWWMRSEKDSKWNAEGRSLYVGEDKMPLECRKKFEDLKKMYGKPPDDLKWGYHRD